MFLKDLRLATLMDPPSYYFFPVLFHLRNRLKDKGFQRPLTSKYTVRCQRLNNYPFLIL